MAPGRETGHRAERGADVDAIGGHVGQGGRRAAAAPCAPAPCTHRRAGRGSQSPQGGNPAGKGPSGITRVSSVLTALSAYTPKKQQRGHWPEARTRQGQLRGSAAWPVCSRPAARAGDRRAGTHMPQRCGGAGERTLRRGPFVTPTCTPLTRAPWAGRAHGELWAAVPGPPWARRLGAEAPATVTVSQAHTALSKPLPAVVCL